MALSVEKTLSGREYKVKDLSQADFGCLELELAEVEMPDLMACRTEFGPSHPFKGARISGLLHMTIQTAVVSEKKRCIHDGLNTKQAQQRFQIIRNFRRRSLEVLERGIDQ
ncbi:adenosylhomocysteinase [Hordeum vulgare]|nr:adenosylhomocysteinase [Hordeum vulgare]